MDARSLKIEPLRQYWTRRVALPSLFTSILLLLGVIGIIRYSIITSEQKSLRAATQTVAILAADPILLGDDFELYKRVGALAKRQNLEVLVKDPSEKVLTSFPAPNTTATQSVKGPEWFSELVLANDGHIIGKVDVRALSFTPFADWRLPSLAALLFFVFFGLVIWLIQSAQPLREDLVSLADIKSIGSESGLPLFRFSETAKTYELLKQQALELIDAGRSQAMNEVATQVAHDIRAPLAALTAATNNLVLLPDDDRTLIRSAITRIRDIANNLLVITRDKTKEEFRSRALSPAEVVMSDEPRTVEMVQALIESTIAQKRAQYRSNSSIIISFNLEAAPFGIFAEVQRTELHRILSNLIDNSIESFENRVGCVEVSFEVSSSTRVKVVVQDNGKGIPPHLLAKVVERGGTFGKQNGNGLGLSHARKTVEAWNGSFHIKSAVGMWTCVELELPRADPPRWFASKIPELTPRVIAVLDDEISIYRMWKNRIKQYTTKEFDPVFLHFCSSDEIIKWYRSNIEMAEKSLFLCDYELIGSRHSGLDVIEMLGISRNAILVTGQAEETSIQERCAKQGIRMLPKMMAPFVPLTFSSHEIA